MMHPNLRKRSKKPKVKSEFYLLFIDNTNLSIELITAAARGRGRGGRGRGIFTKNILF
jgi:hypothetical protein